MRAAAEDRAAGLRLEFDGRLDDREGLRRDLRQAGHAAPTGDDAALALAALSAFGPAGGAARLVGEFAFVLRDARRGAVIAGRDALGLRPLFLHEGARGVVFGRSIAEVVAEAGLPVLPDEGVAAEILACGPRSRAETLVRGVRRVLPGTIVAVEGGRVAETEFRRIDPARVRLPADEDGCVDALREALREAVRCRLADAGPAALCLSGGLDSAAVAAFSGGAVTAFTVAHPGTDFDETELARETAAAAGIPFEIVPATVPAASRFAEDARASLDLPESPPAAALDGLAARIRAGGFAVVLDGEGGDECFSPTPLLVADLLRAGAVGEAWREARRWRGGVGGALGVLAESGVRPLLPSAVRAGLRRLRRGKALPAWIDPGFARRTGLAERLRRAPPRAGRGGFSRAALAEEFVSGYALWARESFVRWGERCGAEPRHPFLDLRVVETALALPHRLRWPEGGVSKTALRRALEGLLPEAVLRRRRKVRFTPLVPAALRRAGMLDRPRAPLLAEAGWIDPAGLARIPSPVALLAVFELETWLANAATAAGAMRETPVTSPLSPQRAGA